MVSSDWLNFCNRMEHCIVTDLDNFRYHLTTHDVSLEKYLRAKQIKLGQDVSSKSIVYLDTRFWLILREAYLGRSKCHRTRKLLQLLADHVSAGRVVCPMSEALFMEVQNQTDPVTRAATAKLVDELSAGVCLVPETNRFGQEFADLLYRLGPSKGDLHNVRELVWTKISYVLGFVTPTMDQFPDDVELALQKDLLDYLWTCPPSMVIGSFTPGDLVPIYDGVSSKLNEGKFAHLGDHNSFKQVFMSEVDGILDGLHELVTDVLARYFEGSTGKEADCTDSRPAKLFSNLVREAIRRNKLSKFVPSLHISASLHAAVRWDKKRKYEDNDFFDFHHAVAALPYCDAFFTEGGLRMLVTRSDIHLDQTYQCRVANDVDDAIRIIGELTTSDDTTQLSR